MVVLVLILMFVVGNLWVTLSRSLIPQPISSRVQSVEVRREKHPGVDDVFIVGLETGKVVVDFEVADLLRIGGSIRKEAFSREAIVDRNVVSLETSRDFGRMLIAMPLLLFCAVLTLRRARRSH